MPDRPTDPDKEARVWREVDRSIWAPSPPRGKLWRLRETVLGIFAFSGISIMVVGGPLAVMVSFFVAYSIAGVAYFGPVLILFWASLVAGFIVIMEKSGKARHFEGKEFPLFRSLVAIPLAFLLVAGSFVLLLVLMHRI